MSHVWRLQPKAEQKGRERVPARLVLPSGLQRLAMVPAWSTSVAQTEGSSTMAPASRADDTRPMLSLTVWTLPLKRAKGCEQHCHGEKP